MDAANCFSVISFSFNGLLKKGGINIFGYLESMKYRYGLDTADIWNGMIPSYDNDFTDLLRDSIKERGLHVVNLACDNAHVWDNDPDTKRKNEDLAWKCISLGEKIGAKTIRIDAGIREETMTNEQLDYITKKYREYCSRAASFGAKLGPENHWGATKSFGELKKIIDAVNESNFGILLHLGRWYEDDKDGSDRALAGKAMHIHIDYAHCAEAERVLPPFRDAGYSGCWAVEDGKGFDEYNTVAFQLTQVKRVIAPLLY